MGHVVLLLFRHVVCVCVLRMYVLELAARSCALQARAPLPFHPIPDVWTPRWRLETGEVGRNQTQTQTHYDCGPIFFTRLGRKVK
jgi:hypothetical protein